MCKARDFYNSFASVDSTRSVATRTAEQYSGSRHRLGARVEARPDLGRRVGLGSAATGAGPRARPASVFASSPAPAARAGRRRTGPDSGRLRRGGVDVRDLILTAGGRIDRWTVSSGRLHERLIGHRAVLTDTRFATAPAGAQPDARASPGAPAAADAAQRRLSRLAAADLNELYRPLRVGVDATAANAELAPERSRD